MIDSPVPSTTGPLLYNTCAEAALASVAESATPIAAERRREVRMRTLAGGNREVSLQRAASSMPTVLPAELSSSRIKLLSSYDSCVEHTLHKGPGPTLQCPPPVPASTSCQISTPMRSLLAATFLLAVILPGHSLVAQGRGGTQPAQPAPPPPTWPSSLPTQRVTYRTLSETNYELERLAAAYPTKVIRFELPHRSLLGQRIWALEISHDVKASSGKPVFLMTGVHHAREWPTNELTMEFVHDLLQNDGVDPRITAALDKVRFIVVPIVNVDGFDMSRTLINENMRKSCRVEPGKVPTWAECANPANANLGVDLNRNYGAFWGGGGRPLECAAAAHAVRRPSPSRRSRTCAISCGPIR